MARDRALNARRNARSGASPRYVNPLARGGLVARRVMYAIIGWIAVQIVHGHSGHQALRSARWPAGCSLPVHRAGPGTVAAGGGRARAGDVRRLFDGGSALALIVAGPIWSGPSWPLQEKTNPPVGWSESPWGGREEP